MTGEPVQPLPPFPAKRIIKPQQPKGQWRPIIALSHDLALTERGGEHDIRSVPAMLRTEPSSILVSQDFAPHLARLIAMYDQDEDFNYRITPRYRNDRERVSGMAVDAVVNYVGWQAPADEDGKRSHKGARYHYPLEPVHLVQCGIDDLRPDPNESRLDKLLAWAQEVRNWCHSHGLRLTPSSGGIVAQLLRHPMFYPEPRRKVPGRTNAYARPQLPGNYYRLHCPERQPHRAYYLDLTSAHHRIALTTRFPDANSLYIYGRHPDDGESDRPRRFYAEPTDALLSQFGLFHLSLSVPHIPARRFPPPWGQRSGLVDAWVYSNELATLREIGVRIDGIYTAIVSPDQDEGLSAYARWCLDELNRHPDWKPWLKPILHSTYGVLAARPIPFETGFYRAAGGRPREYHMGRHSFTALARSTRRPVESKLANVVHRGLIEAGVRTEALWMARYLTEVERHHILAVYADSLFVLDSGRPLPILPPWWRVDAHLHDLVFYDATHFTSTDLVRMPGMSRNRRDVERLIARLERDAVLHSAHRPLRRAAAERRRQKARDSNVTSTQEQARRGPGGNRGGQAHPGA